MNSGKISKLFKRLIKTTIFVLLFLVLGVWLCWSYGYIPCLFLGNCSSDHMAAYFRANEGIFQGIVDGISEDCESYRGPPPYRLNYLTSFVIKRWLHLAFEPSVYSCDSMKFILNKDGSGWEKGRAGEYYSLQGYTYEPNYHPRSYCLFWLNHERKTEYFPSSYDFSDFNTLNDYHKICPEGTYKFSVSRDIGNGWYLYYHMSF